MKTILTILVTTLISLNSRSQKPTKWSFSAIKITDKTYEIHFKATVQHPWHIYSQTSPDEGALPTKIRLNKNPLVTIDGEIQEIGNLVTKYEAVFGVSVKYFDDSVDFVQTVKLKSKVKTNLTGTVDFMVCNNTQCLPPDKISFSIPVQ